MTRTRRARLASLAVCVGAATALGVPASAASAEERGSDVPRVTVPRGPGQDARMLTARAPQVQRLAARSARAQQANAADRHFVHHMIPHHFQAILMSRMAPQRATNKRVLALAERILVEQKVEIDAMQGWQGREGVPVTDEREAYHHMVNDPEMVEEMGMATPAQMKKLRTLKGRAFNKRFLNLMIPHHQGALRMSETVAGSGNDLFVRQLAIDLISAQSRQVYDMREILRDIAGRATR